MSALLTQPSPRSPRAIRVPLAFIIVASLMFAVDGAILHSPKFNERPELLAEAASIDLTLGVALAYYLLVIRRSLASARTLLPVFLASVVAARFTLPVGHRDAVAYVRYLGIPFEIALLTLIAVGVRPFVRNGSRSFSYHKRNSLAAILYALCIASATETVALHFLLRAVAPRAAFLALAVSAFGTIWIVGFARAVQLRPILVTADTLHVRSGVQWTLDVPRAAIAHIDFGRVKAPGMKTPGYLRATLGQPNVLIELREPMRARGPYGVSREVQCIGLVIDDLAGFCGAMDTIVA